MTQIRQVEQSLFQPSSINCMGSARSLFKQGDNTAVTRKADIDDNIAYQMINVVAVSYLIKQHKVQILDN